MKVSDKVRSPCVSICALDGDDICVGCYRTMDEIMHWSQMNNDQRREVLQKIAERERKHLI